MKIQQLNEALFNTKEIVNFIYNDYFKQYQDILIKYITSGKPLKQEFPKMPAKQYSPQQLFYNIKDPVFHKALTINPVHIYCGAFKTGSYYNPIDQAIYISFNISIYNILRTQADSNTFDELADMLDKRMIPNFKTELNGTGMQHTIAHEISHWLDDTYNSGHLKKMVSSVKLLGTRNQKDKLLNRGEVDTYLTDYEINAIVHGVAAIKDFQNDQEMWDSMTWRDLLDIDSSIRSSFIDIRNIGEEHGKDFIKKLYTRLHREGLLGKRMNISGERW